MQYKDVFDMDFAHHNNNNNNNNNEGGGQSSNGNAASSGCNEVGSTSSNSTSHAHVVSASLAAGEEGREYSFFLSKQPQIEARSYLKFDV